VNGFGTGVGTAAEIEVGTEVEIGVGTEVAIAVEGEIAIVAEVEVAVVVETEAGAGLLVRMVYRSVHPIEHTTCLPYLAELGVDQFERRGTGNDQPLLIARSAIMSCKVSFWIPLGAV
jgi:hypothetical protein